MRLVRLIEDVFYRKPQCTYIYTTENVKVTGGALMVTYKVRREVVK